jgi:hypothetical protein
MSRNFVYLSGSRSLDFFVPGSTTENSDWDFYVPNDSMHVSAFLADMENIGVMWYSPLQEIVRLMEGEKGGYVRVEKDAWEDTFCTDSLGQAAIALGYVTICFLDLTRLTIHCQETLLSLSALSNPSPLT